MGHSSDIISQALSLARKQGADAADAVLFETVDHGVSWRMGKAESIERSESKAIGLRAFVGNRQAIASCTDLHPQALAELATRAVAIARASTPDPDSTLASKELWAHTLPKLDLCDAGEPTNEWLIGQCQMAEKTALDTKGITNSEGADASYSRSQISLGISSTQAEFLQSYETSHFSISASVLAGSGTEMERDYEYSSTRHRSDLKPADWIGQEAAKRALARLNPRKIQTCQAPVVFDPRVSKSLVSILASAISGTAIARGSSFLKDTLGQAVFPNSIQVFDDPHLPRGLSSRPFDAEGLSIGKQAIIDRGVLQSWLLDVRTANKLKQVPNGRASRGIASPPSPSSTNLYLEKGAMTPQQLIAEIGNGLYLTETFGMGINTVTGDYSQGAAGFWIENGEIAYPVSEITIAGNLREMFASLTAANDLVFRYGTNAPTLRVERMTIAGV